MRMIIVLYVWWVYSISGSICVPKRVIRINTSFYNNSYYEANINKRFVIPLLNLYLGPYNSRTAGNLSQTFSFDVSNYSTVTIESFSQDFSGTFYCDNTAITTISGTKTNLVFDVSECTIFKYACSVGSDSVAGLTRNIIIKNMVFE